MIIKSFILLGEMETRSPLWTCNMSPITMCKNKRILIICKTKRNNQYISHYIATEIKIKRSITVSSKSVKDEIL